MKRNRFMAITLVSVLTCLSIFSSCSDARSNTEKNGNSDWPLVVPCEYDSVKIDLGGNFIKVSKDNKFGLYKKEADFSYKLLFSPEYEKISYSSGDTFYLTKDNQTSVYTSQGTKQFEQSYSEIWSSTGEQGFSVKEKDGSWGFISNNGEWIIPPQYSQLIPLEAGNLFLVYKDGVQDVINLSGNSIIPPQMRVETAETNYPYIYVANQEYTAHGVLDTSGNIVVPLEYKSIQFYPSFGQSAAYFICKDSDNNYSVLNSNGEVLLSKLPYESVEPTSENHFIVIQNGKYGLMRLDGTLSIPIDKDSISFPCDYDQGLVIKDKNFSICNLDGKTTQVKANIDHATGFAYTYKSGLFRIDKENKYGYMDLDGELTIPLSYEYADRDIYNDLFLVKKDNKFGFIDKNNTIKIPFEYSFASNFQSGYAMVARDDKMGIIDSTGQVIVPYQFEIPSSISENNQIVDLLDSSVYPVKKDGKYGCLIVAK